jgi:hypothetical protein
LFADERKEPSKDGAIEDDAEAEDEEVEEEVEE